MHDAVRDRDTCYVAGEGRGGGSAGDRCLNIQNIVFLMGTAALYRVCSTGLR